MWEGARSRTIGLVSYLGGPRLRHIGIRNMLAWIPKVFVVMTEVAWGN